MIGLPLLASDRDGSSRRLIQCGQQQQRGHQTQAKFPSELKPFARAVATSPPLPFTLAGVGGVIAYEFPIVFERANICTGSCRWSPRRGNARPLFAFCKRGSNKLPFFKELPWNMTRSGELFFEKPHILSSVFSPAGEQSS